MNYHIEFFYDKSIRLWTALLLDEEGNEVSTALYESTKNKIKKLTIKDFIYQPNGKDLL
ncbi:MAG: hypothetical protein WC679_02145 [Bacteroidales bacterium]|jgi:hypothetical protein